MLVTLKEILKDSVEKGYAVGAFDTTEHPFAEYIIEAAENQNKPVIMMVPGFAFGSRYDEEFYTYLVQRIKEAKVPICLHLDHGASFEEVMKAIHFGFSGVMIDGSALPNEENIALTKKVVEAAHACGVSVEAEIGHVAGAEATFNGGVADESCYTKVEDAVQFVKETNVDALAVAIGTVHGVYKGTPKLDLQRLDEIRAAVDIPLVMHGGSGLQQSDYENVVAHGINKINYFTEMALAAVKAMGDAIQAKNGKMHFPEALGAAEKAVVEIIERQIKVFKTEELS